MQKKSAIIHTFPYLARDLRPSTLRASHSNRLLSCRYYYITVLTPTSGSIYSNELKATLHTLRALYPRYSAFSGH